MFHSAGRFWAALCAASVLAMGAFASVASAQDFSAPGGAFNVLPPGQAGSFSFGPNASDQIPLYDGLTPKRGNVTAADLPNHFKQNVFGLGEPFRAAHAHVPGPPGSGHPARHVQRAARHG